MQTNKQLTSAFDHACSWNALLYSVHKLSATALTFLLYTKFNAQSFSLYANINSIIFLLLLWLDFGFKKSIARFLPEYEKSDMPFQMILRNIVKFKIITLLAGLCLFLYYIKSVFIFLHIDCYTPIIYPAGLVFFTEGILIFFQLVYHAYFLNKYFNIISSISLVIQSIIALTICFYLPTHNATLACIFWAKALINVCTLFASFYMLYVLKKDRKKLTTTAIEDVKNSSTYKNINTQFIQHSGLMWISTTLKSLTERNALMPLFTYILGTEHANLFKVTNESALFFYRIALKTIGTNDTALLAQAKMSKLEIATIFQHLKHKISLLCLGISCIFIPIFLSKWYTNTHIQSVQLFFIITLCYLLEVYLSPYERILEVEQQYNVLFKSYVPYIVLLACIFGTPIVTTIGLLASLLTIHGIRLISAFLLMLYAQKKYQDDYNLSIHENNTTTSS